jgi:hypothetical protein
MYRSSSWTGIAFGRRDVQGNGLVSVAAKAAHCDIAVAGIERLAERRPPLRRSWEPSMRLRSTPQQRTGKLPGLPGAP